MAFVQVTIVPGVTAEQYDGVIEAAQGGKLADGEIFHVAGQGPEGWVVIDAWESREQCDRSMANLVPAFMAAKLNPETFGGYEIEIHRQLSR